MKRLRQIQILLWTVLFILQFLVGGMLAFALVKHPENERVQVRTFQPSRVYGTIVAEGGHLSTEEQRSLLSLCRDLEKMINNQERFEASILGEVRVFYLRLLTFLAFSILLQALILTVTVRSRRTETPQ